jgi:hypothetical protein
MVAGICGLLVLAAALLISRGSKQPVASLAVSTSPGGTGDKQVSRNPVISQDDRFERLAVGTWQDFYHGKRTLTLRPDGTATMVVELRGWKARMFTSRLELDIVWRIEDGKMHRRTVGGRPAAKVEFVNRRSGVAVAEPIRRLEADVMVLADQDGSREYTWRRVD